MLFYRSSDKVLHLKYQVVTHVYTDVARNVKKWKAEGIKIFIFSHAWVNTQRLFMKKTNHGELFSYIDGFHDTHELGSITDAATFQRLVTQMGTSPADTLFLTKGVGEGRAAKQAGIHAILVISHGHQLKRYAPEDLAAFERIRSFDELIWRNPGGSQVVASGTQGTSTAAEEAAVSGQSAAAPSGTGSAVASGTGSAVKSKSGSKVSSKASGSKVSGSAAGSQMVSGTPSGSKVSSKASGSKVSGSAAGSQMVSGTPSGSKVSGSASGSKVSSKASGSKVSGSAAGSQMASGTPSGSKLASGTASSSGSASPPSAQMAAGSAAPGSATSPSPDGSQAPPDQNGEAGSQTSSSQ